MKTNIINEESREEVHDFGKFKDLDRIELVPNFDVKQIAEILSLDQRQVLSQLESGLLKQGDRTYRVIRTDTNFEIYDGDEQVAYVRPGLLK